MNYQYFLLLTTTLPSLAAVSFIETFEAPGGPFSADGNINLPTGTYSFDQSGWLVNSTTPAGVFYVQDPTSTQINTGSRAIALGGASTTGANGISITIPGFLGQTIGSLSYSHYSSGNQNQGIRISLTDPLTMSVLYTADHFNNDSINDAAFTLPSGPTAVFSAVQIGDTLGSDSGIDNISITTIPEPSSALLLLIGCSAILRRKR